MSTAAGARGTGRAEQHSLGRAIVLHLLPGALITLCFAILAPLVRAAGFPSLFAIFLAIALVLIPCELGYLLREGVRRNGRPSLDGVVLYRERTPPRLLVPLVLGLFLWSGVSLGVAALLDRPLIAALFGWLPGWFFLAEDFAAYSRPALLITWALGLVANGIAGPVVEELYFRGYLLPRLERFEAWAPALNTLLFSLYHFFTPWQNIGRIVGLLPLVYAVRWRRDIRIGIVVHVAGNLFAMFAMLPQMLG